MKELYTSGELRDGRRLVYYDTADYPAEIVHDEGRFIAFSPVDETEDGDLLIPVIE